MAGQRHHLVAKKMALFDLEMNLLQFDRSDVPDKTPESSGLWGAAAFPPPDHAQPGRGR